MLKKNTRKTFYVGSEDMQAIEIIRARFGLSTDSDAVRFCLRLVAQNPIQIPKPKKSKTVG